MSTLLISYVVIASIALAVACHHLLISFRRRDLVVHRSFAALSGMLALHDGLILARFRNDLNSSAVLWLDWFQWLVELGALALLIGFVARFTRGEGSPFARWSRLAILPLALVHIVLAPEGFARTGEAVILVSDLPGGDRYHSVEGPLRWSYLAFVALTLAAMGWCLHRAWRQARGGERLRGYALLVALVLVLLAILNSFIFLDLMEFATFQVIDHSFVALAVVMSLILSDEVVRAGRLQGRLAASEADLRSTLDAISDGVVAVDHRGDIVRVNPAARDLVAASGPLEGRAVAEVFRTVDNDQGAPVPLPLEALLAGDPQPPGDPVSLDAPGSRVRDVQIAGAPVRRRDGVVTGAVLVIRDVSERMELEEQLLQSRKMDALGQLAGGIAHDFNNMLTGIMGGAELLAAQLDHEPAMKEQAQVIGDSAERAGELTQQLLAFARRGKMVKRPMSVHECIDAAMALFRRGSAGAIQIELDLAADHEVVRGDAAMFQNAILNLAVNARDAMSNGGGVLGIATATRSESGKQVVEVVVSDTGSGIASDLCERIFEPFFTTKEEGYGTGLGLAAVYGTVQAMGGRIRCDSEPGQGTVFTITLPAASGTVTATRRYRTPSHGAGRILVVDDEEMVRTTTVAMLKSLGYTVDAADGGEAALERFGDGTGYDLVVLDIVMPGMRGDEVYRQLKRRHAQVRCIVVSGYTRDASIDEMRSSGVEVVLIKPFRIDDLANAVRKAMC